MSDARTLPDDDGFHEIQLNGKQLVFLGMTTTLVSVVIFLCGVLVGRGVKPLEPVAEAAVVQVAPVIEPSLPAETVPAPAAGQATQSAPAPTPAAPAAAPADTAPAQTALAQAAEPAPVDELKADNPDPVRGRQSQATPTPAPAPAPSTPAPKPAASVAAAATESKTPADQAITSRPVAAPAAAKGGSVAVQVAALSSRTDAEAIARKLTGKGYAAYVLTPEPGARQVFKVRVGDYASADEAIRVSRRLQQEEKLQPWVIR